MPESLFTIAVHAGRPDEGNPSIPSVPGIDLAVSYRAADAATLHAMLGGDAPGFSYSRYGSPTNAALEAALCQMEGAAVARACASGMAAVHLALLLTGLQAGDTLLVAQDSYGATFALVDTIMRRMGVCPVFVDATNRATLAAALAEHRPRALILEPISNPLLRLCDVSAAARLCHEHDVQLVVDATFATPYLLRPLELGADIVLHSLTKYLAGHDDVLGGIVLAGESYVAELRTLTILTGGLLDPHAAYLALRGLRTLPLRMREHCRNAAEVASWLVEQPGVAQVYYPGLPSHPQHHLTRQLLPNGAGGMVAFDLVQANEAAVLRFLDALQMILPVTTLGGVASQILYPACSSHRSLSVERRHALGIGDGLLRLSVGIEDAVDIQADLARGFAAAAKE
ncbi:PLP-dependent transferase [Candidatus Chloroploca sp. M-50]|uniref:PLP-dependent transferase n=1 Tax=Candidatus Chloroploca mongolica TaxID=2528176 RepID=A0ABS4D729_9CHLR|nr:PLP-dependent aspartate aminotransferase family protein [Candidatus Chloroploca mongolica]MBP1465244.1 PLP-dependent transferase [Candidatus Chloroploca mongolica]